MVFFFFRWNIFRVQSLDKNYKSKTIEKVIPQPKDDWGLEADDWGQGGGHDWGCAEEEMTDLSDVYVTAWFII